MKAIATKFYMYCTRLKQAMIDEVNWKQIFAEKSVELLIVVVAGYFVLNWVKSYLNISQDIAVIKIAIDNSQIWGLKTEVDSGELFNDFDYGDQKFKWHERPVQFAWSDPSGEYRCTHEITNNNYITDQFRPTHQLWTRLLKEECTLRVGFSNLAWGVNVALRPKNEMPIDISNRKLLHIQARSPREENVGFRVRIVDENNIHWMYGDKYSGDSSGELKIQYYSNDKNGKKMAVQSMQWETFSIPLDTAKWTHFYYDGPRDIPQIAKINTHKILLANLIILEIGLEPKSEDKTSLHNLTQFAQSQNEGFIDIKKIWFE